MDGAVQSRSCGEVERNLAYVALGSNLGDRDAHLAFAVRRLETLPGTSVVARSTVYESAPVGPGSQPDYLNAVVALETRLAPDLLLEGLHGIEAAAGRVRAGAPRWGPRPLDLDLLLYSDRCVETEDLTLPHPRLHERGFVLAPLRELAAELVHPRLGRSIAALAEELDEGDEARPWRTPLPPRIAPGEGE